MEKLNSSKFTILKRKYFRNSRIYTALYRENNQIYKVKVVPKIRAKELQILQKDLPPSCVKLLDHFKINKEDTQKESALVFPYYPSRISSVLSHVEELIPLETFQKWIKQIANTVNQLHKLGIIHADINPSNILLTEKKRNFEKADCVICDFGISSINSMKYSLKKAGTPSYIEPQVQFGDDPTTDSDVYSIGILMLSIVLKNRFNEFMMNPANKSLQAIKQKINEINFAPGKNNELAQLISKSICHLRAERIKLDEFLNHSFFDGTPHEPYPCSLEVDPQVALQGEFKEIKRNIQSFSGF